jgi:uncharacterized protein (DUF488 family)
MTTVFTIGHSNHSIEAFIALLKKAGITRIADVRSIPHSRFCPQFRRDPLTAALAAAGIDYVWHGAALGGRPRDAALSPGGKPDYAAMAQQPAFRAALAKVFDEAAERPTAMMCAERDPLDCHRFHLLSAPMTVLGAEMAHVLVDGTVESQASAEARLKRRDRHGRLFG